MIVFSCILGLLATANAPLQDNHPPSDQLQSLIATSDSLRDAGEMELALQSYQNALSESLAQRDSAHKPRF